MTRTILHVDMDAFYVSVELLRRPELRGQPVIVGGSGNRGVVAAASYEARAFGVHSAMPSTRARRLCPQAVFLPGDHAHYSRVSDRVMAIFRAVTPLVEPISLDEAFLDATGVRRLHGDGTTIAHALRARVHDAEGLTCSVGVATNKFLAKLASEAAKPRATPTGPAPGLGVKVVEPGSELAFLHPLPARALWGVGPATLERLERLGVRTVGDIARLPADALVASLGRANGHHLHQLSLGVDDREVVPDQPPKSISHEETYAADHHRRDSLTREAVRMADAVAGRLRRHALAGRTVSIKVRFHDFRTITRSTTFPAPIDDTATITRAAKALVAQIDPSPGVRLLGVAVSGLGAAGGRQLSLDDLTARSWYDASGAVDAIRQRFGDASIGPAVLAEPGGDIRVKRRGDQQWGPRQGGDEPSAR
jgi:DNA polymerase-4